jgi:hypothetical protein
MSIYSFSITIPCKSYIKKYCVVNYGDPIFLSFNSSFGDTVLTKISSPDILIVNKDAISIAFRHFNAKLKFVLPFHWFGRVSTELSEQQIFRINKYIEGLFKDDLYSFVRISSWNGISRKKAILFFTDFYDINIGEELSYDALKKAEYRRRVASKKFMPQMSPDKTAVVY